ncbi:hypothetical protein HUW51_01835 [Adhaeribacter swui]|uniref:Sugar-non-specific nuclease inhibitor NuiA-like protein n=1 Tax=Adhaeribacter swui TaxID=2086471 RepID=A0A7G7G2Z1_9BACT|nr:nuclease A inhibitor family protein [Adhaeribacter swui]QNF31525.1 hypothetical protein HUW51_01835 [Adhaeribacter swui]
MENISSLTAEEIITRLQQLTAGVSYQSESDFPVEVVQLHSTEPDRFTRESILTLTGHPLETPVAETSIAVFFGHLVQSEKLPVHGDNAVDQITALQSICTQQLQSIQVFRIGSRTITILLLGKTPEGIWVGLKTTAIET